MSSLTITEAAVQQRVHPDTVRRWIKSGRLAAIRNGAGAYLISPADLNALTGPAPTPATVTVTADGGGDGAWSVSIDGSGISGTGSETRARAEAALWNTPTGGGTVAVPGVGAIRVPHRAAGQAASISLAGMAASPGGGSVTFTVRADDAATAEVA